MQGCIVLVVEQAETLDPVALPVLQRIANAPGALLHGSAVEPGGDIGGFRQDTFGVGEA